MSENNVRPLTKGETRELGSLMPGVSKDKLTGKVLSVDGKGGGTMEVSYMEVRLGTATVTPEASGYRWDWN